MIESVWMDDDFCCRQAVEGKVDGEEERSQPTVATRAFSPVDVLGKKVMPLQFRFLVFLPCLFDKVVGNYFVSVNFLVPPLLLCQWNLVNLSRKEEFKRWRWELLHIVNKIHMRCVWYEIVFLSFSIIKRRDDNEKNTIFFTLLLPFSCLIGDPRFKRTRHYHGKRFSHADQKRYTQDTNVHFQE